MDIDTERRQHQRGERERDGWHSAALTGVDGTTVGV